MVSRLIGAVLFGAMLCTLGDRAAEAGSLHSVQIRSIDGSLLNFADFAGKPVLVVNTASRCGFTGQYAGLQEIWDTYRDRGLVVLGVPSDDFNQELASEAAVKEFCEVNFSIDFPMTEIVHVRGAQAHPLFQELGASLGAPKWNFYKYLIGVDGVPVASWPSSTGPTNADLVGRIEAELSGAS